MNLEILQNLGNGVMGTVYLCKYGNDHAIAKLEKNNIATFGASNFSRSNYGRQIIFNE